MNGANKNRLSQRQCPPSPLQLRCQKNGNPSIGQQLPQIQAAYQQQQQQQPFPREFTRSLCKNLQKCRSQRGQQQIVVHSGAENRAKSATRTMRRRMKKMGASSRSREESSKMPWSTTQCPGQPNRPNFSSRSNKRRRRMTMGSKRPIIMDLDVTCPPAAAHSTSPRCR